MAHGTHVVQLTSNTIPDYSPKWSPDGARIAFTSERDGDWEIYSMEADGSGVVQITNNGVFDDITSWSPDGMQIAFSSKRDASTQDIYVMDADGTDVVRLTTDPGTDTRPCWSPDGTRIAFMSDRDGDWKIFTMNTDGTQVIQVTNGSGQDWDPSWSPNGARLVFASTRSGDWEIYSMNADGTDVFPLTDNSAADERPVWSPIRHRVEMALPDTVADYAIAIQVPVRIGDTTGEGIVSVEAFVGYDGDLLIPGVPPVTSTTLTDGWTLESNLVQGNGTPIDTLKIALADETALVGSGDLLRLHFTTADVRHPTSSLLTLTHILFNDGTPAASPTAGSVTLVGADGIITSLPGEIIPRWSVGVSVIDADADLDGTPGTDQVSVDVENTGNGDTATLILEETVATAGSFTGSVDTEFGLPPLVDGLIQAQAGDAIIFTFVDELDSEGNGPIDRTDQTDVIGGTDGALRVTVVTQPGDTVRVRVSDVDLNTDPGDQETTTVEAVNSITGESETITLTELDDDNEVFFGIIKTTYGASAGTDDDGVFNAQKGDELVITYADTLLANGGTADLPDIDYVVDPFGDADANGQVQAFDAAKVLLHCLVPYLTGLDSLSANLDLLAFDPDPAIGKITPYDASLLLQKRVGLIDRFEVQEDEADNHPQPETDSSVPKPVPEERRLALKVHDGYLSVWADERDGILSGDLLLERIEGSAVVSEELSGFLSASRGTKDGLRVVFAGAEAVTGPGELLRVNGVGPDLAQLTRATLNDGRLRVRLDDQMSESRGQPPSFALYPNVPNPFNPETVIRYDVPEAGTVSLRIYDITGQVVRELVRDFQEAGSYSVIWNGRNRGDVQVANGLYLYELRAGDDRAIRKMILTK